MRTVKIVSFGNTYILSGAEAESYETLRELFDEEENYILSVKNDYKLEVREDLVILFVQMYLLRFAIPYYQLNYSAFPDKSNIGFLKKVLYFCLIGRFVDDLVDNDSKLFKTYESILLFQKYYPRLTQLLSDDEKVEFDEDLFQSARYTSPTIEGPITFSDISNDVYWRIKYFFCAAATHTPGNSGVLRTYMGILLGGLDVNDLIADGYQKRSSTLISNHVYSKYYNDEEKLLLDPSLLRFYSSIKYLFESESNSLVDYCNENELFYTANILNSIKR